VFAASARQDLALGERTKRGGIADVAAELDGALTAGFSASRRATTEPEEPDPQTMKS
jgi:hypothetical protein